MDGLYLRFDDKITEQIFTCKQCGKCCNGITFDKSVLTDEDISRLEKGLGKPLKEIFSEDELIHINHDGKILLSMKQPCKFLKDNKCSIHEFRPLTCRQYPLYCGEGIIKIDELDCPGGKELYEEKKKQYAIKVNLVLDNPQKLEIIDTQTRGDEVNWNQLFLFNGKLYNYYDAIYNNTSLNEREIEIPIIVDYLRRVPAQNILEIGNVLSHYFGNAAHDIVDKEEKANGVINEDIVKFAPNKKYDLIISISTMEHVGMEGDGVFRLSRGQVKLGFENVKTLLTPTGKFVFTIPLYYNPDLDYLIKSEDLVFDETYTMERDMESQKWKQIEFSNLKGKPWNGFVQNALDAEENVYALRRTKYLLIGVIHGKEDK